MPVAPVHASVTDSCLPALEPAVGCRRCWHSMSGTGRRCVAATSGASRSGCTGTTSACDTCLLPRMWLQLARWPPGHARSTPLVTQHDAWAPMMASVCLLTCLGLFTSCPAAVILITATLTSGLMHGLHGCFECRLDLLLICLLTNASCRLPQAPCLPMGCSCPTSVQQIFQLGKLAPACLLDMGYLAKQCPDIQQYT